MRLSVIIPTFNEEKNIGSLVNFVFLHGQDAVGEVIVVDGYSNDNTLSTAKKAGATTFLSTQRSRATQMNLGAKHAKYDILYFIHADIKLVSSFVNDIVEALKSGYDAGCYRFQFDSPRRILKANSYFTRFNGIMCRGGDQTLFIRKEIFHALNGYDEYFVIMEDYDLLQRIQKKYAFRIIPKNIIVSSRKYDTNSWIKVQVANFTVFLMYFFKRPPVQMASFYKKMLNYR